MKVSVLKVKLFRTEGPVVRMISNNGFCFYSIADLNKLISTGKTPSAFYQKVHALEQKYVDSDDGGNLYVSWKGMIEAIHMFRPGNRNSLAVLILNYGEEPRHAVESVINSTHEVKSEPSTPDRELKEALIDYLNEDNYLNVEKFLISYQLFLCSSDMRGFLAGTCGFKNELVEKILSLPVGHLCSFTLSTAASIFWEINEWKKECTEKSEVKDQKTITINLDKGPITINLVIK